MMYTITFANLDVDEADHISQILNDYLCDNLERRIKAVNQGDENLVAFYDAHLEWHKKVMEKCNGKEIKNRFIMSIYTRVRQFCKDNPSEVTCKYCGDVRYYSHTCFYEDRCPNCHSIAFDCRKSKHIPLKDLPKDAIVRSEWA